MSVVVPAAFETSAYRHIVINIAYCALKFEFVLQQLSASLWFLSSRCWANFDFLLYLKSLMCSLNVVLNDLPVCAVYVILQSGQVSCYTPHFAYLG